jgi:radical SAM protein with 4Fe4S-binding SPASM domain
MAHYRKQQITFLLTNKCNFNCDYCYVNKHPNDIKKLDIEFAKCGLNDFFNSNQSKEIRFFAEGEPTLEFSLMKEIKDYAYSLAGDKLKVELQTNGFFSQRIAEWISQNVNIIWISQNVNIIWISHDGPNAHQAHRKMLGCETSSLVIEKNIQFLSKNKDLILGIRTTITPENIDNQEELVEFFSRLGVKAIAVDPVFLKVGSKSGKGINLLDFAKKFLIAKKRAEKLNIFYSSMLTCNFDEKTKIACRACIPCPHLTPDGFVSACDMATSGDTALQEFIYGKYNKEKNKIEYSDEKIKLLQSRNTDNLVKCENCKVLNNCAGGCLGETINECGDLFNVRKEFCLAVKYLADHIECNGKLYPYLHP